MAQAYEYQLIEDVDSNIVTELNNADAQGWQFLGIAYEGTNQAGQRTLGILMNRRL